MLIAPALVLKVRGETAWVKPESSTCSACSGGGGCSLRLLGDLSRGPRDQLRVRNAVSAAVGDRVEVAIDERTLVRGCVAVFLLPLLVMFAAAAAARQWTAESGTETWVLLAGAAGLTLTLCVLRAIFRRRWGNGRLQPVLIRVLSAAGTAAPARVHSGELV